MSIRKTLILQTFEGEVTELTNNTPPDYQAIVEGTIQYYNNYSIPSRGITIFLALIMTTVGFLVNACVLFVFLKRFPPSAIRTYMVTLSLCDLLACAAGLPLEIYMHINAYRINGEWLCKLHYAITSWSTTTSSFTTVAIAMDRLRRVKAPTFKDDDKYRSYWAAAVVVLGASTLTLPFVALAGLTMTRAPAKHKWDPPPSLRSCWLEDWYAKHNRVLLPTAYRLVLTLTFLGSCSLICGSYSLIAYNIYDLTKNISDEINYALDHPTQKYRLTLPDIPHETAWEDRASKRSRKVTSSSVRHSKADSVLPQDAFAAKMHARYSRHRPPPSIASQAAQSKTSRIQRFSMAMSIKSNKRKMKKMSDALVSFFVEPEKESSVSGTTFVSKGGDSSMGLSPIKLSSQKLTSPTQHRSEADVRSGRKALRPEGQTPLVTALSKTFTEMKPNVNLLEDSESVMDFNQSADRVQDKKALDPARDPPSVVNQSKPESGRDQGVLKRDRLFDSGWDQGSLKRDMTSKAGRDQRVLKRDQSSNAVVGLEEGRRISGLCEQELEMLETLVHLEEIRSIATSSMLTLILLFLFTWLPTLLARLVATKPVYVCLPVDRCWTNLSAYAVLSVYLCSTVNPFFYCFGNVHFRQQVRLVFKQVRDRCSAVYRQCFPLPEKKKKRTRRRS